MSSPWLLAIAIYVGMAILTAIPILLPILGRVELHPGGPDFTQSKHFSDAARERLQSNFERLRGTLGFWKKQARIYRRLHLYCLCWTIPSSVVIPCLAQASTTDLYSKWLITVVSAFSAILIAFHRAFKISENYKAFREGESNFYDTYRRMLDRPSTFGKTENIQITTYLDEVENLRKFVRNAEIDNTPTLEQSKSQNSNEGS